MDHGGDLAIRTEFDVQRSLRVVGKRCPLNLGQILHRTSTIGALDVFTVLYPVGESSNRVEIIRKSSVKRRNRR